MSVALRFEFDEASVRRFYRRIDPDNLLGNPMDSFYKRVAGTIRKKAQGYAPKDTGALRKSIKVERTKKLRGSLRGVAVVVRSPYGLFVHEGTRPHMPPVDALRGWAARKGMSPWAVALGIAAKGTEAQPFLKRAADETRRALPIELRTAARDIERKWRV